MEMKTIFMIYCVLFKNISIIATKYNLDDDSEPIQWNAHNLPQDGYGGHNGNWAIGKTKQDAVWKLFH